MNKKLVMFLLCFTTIAQAADVIPDALRGDYVPKKGSDYSCDDVYLYDGVNQDGWRIEAKAMYQYEFMSELIKNTGSKTPEGGFKGKFKNFYLDEQDSDDIKVLTPTPKGLIVEITEGKKRNKQEFTRCTVEDYKLAMRRVAAVIIGKPLMKKDIDFSREQAIGIYNHYREKPLYGLDPGSISM